MEEGANNSEASQTKKRLHFAAGIQSPLTETQQRPQQNTIWKERRDGQLLAGTFAPQEHAGTANFYTSIQTLNTSRLLLLPEINFTSNLLPEALLIFYTALSSLSV